ncbi:MAG: recombination-associated protein RdgC [Gammaproteobacteria bacterium]|nr:recombination-associated protein RdgC [Gammaproteobacteria bacterium]
MFSFRNLRLYRLTQTIDLSPDTVAAALANDTFKPAAGLEMKRLGWVSPFGRNSDELLLSSSGNLLISLQVEEKLLPSAVIKQELEEAVEAREAESGQPVSRRDKTALREAITQKLLPLAFSRLRRRFAAILPAEGLVVVDASSAGAAEELLGHLRRSLGSLPVTPASTNSAPSALMTGWLADAPWPAGVVVGDEAELKAASDDGGVVRCKQQDLRGDEIAAHLAAGKRAVALAVTWQDRLSFVLRDDLSIRRLRYLDTVKEQAESGAEDARARLDADFTLLVGELRNLLPDLAAAFDGWAEAPST